MMSIPETAGSSKTYPLVARTPAMRALLADIERVAGTTATVLLRGESGVGKEIVARAIHQSSPRRSQPLVKVNCAALPTELLESELFGHERGAFTGAYRRKPGKFELAAGGTIFLDEIGDLSLPLQAKLLHVLQDGEFARVGGSEVLRSTGRLITATNCDLEIAMRSGRFRTDLYYRLNVITLRVPPLRERREEIPILAGLFLARFNAEYGREVELGPDAIALLKAHSWPGNVRELENMIRRVVVLQNGRLLADELALSDPAPDPEPAPEQPQADGTPSLERANLRSAARKAALDAEREVLRQVLQRVQWNRAEAARLLGLSYKGLLYKLEKCGFHRKRGAGPPNIANPDDSAA